MQFSGISGRLIPRIANIGVVAKAAPERQQITRFWFDALAFSLVLAFFAYMAWGMRAISAPIAHLEHTPISLSPHMIPEYALRTTLRMLIAVVVSLVFTLVYATAAAKSRKAGQILIPLLDILQSVPVLGYISFTVTGFIALFPGSSLGPECAAIFAIFTSQAWNMAFSLYQSLGTIPHDIDEAAYVFRLSGWQKFWKMELPYAMPGLIWNTMMSMSGGWFFVVASEAITVGNQHVALPGIGSYIALAIEQRDLTAIGYAILAMTIVILLYDQLLFRPLVAWSDKFRYEMTASGEVPCSWVLDLFAGSPRAQQWLLLPFNKLAGLVLRLKWFAPKAGPSLHFTKREARLFDYLWYAVLALAGVAAARHVVMFLMESVSWKDVFQVSQLAGFTLARVVVLIALASLLWVPLGILIGLNHKLARLIQPLAQFLAAFPANLLFPVAVMLISHYDLNPDIWLSPLMILGTQWYITFNVIAGASAFPNDMREAARNFHVRGWLWWKKVMLPGIFPYFLTGAITASGGAWNASIVAEAVQWGDKSYTARGLGAYIARMTEAGDFPHIALGVGVMAIVVVMCNKFFWRPLYDMAARKLRFD